MVNFACPGAGTEATLNGPEAGAEVTLDSPGAGAEVVASNGPGIHDWFSLAGSASDGSVPMVT